MTNAPLPEEEVIFPSEDDGRAQGAPPALRDAGPHAELGTPYLPNLDSSQARARWQTIQAGFVDDPRQSVADAHQLVSHLMQRIVDSFAAERAALEQQWANGGEVSTEDLRVSLQRYRSFFGRLLPVTPDVRR